MAFHCGGRIVRDGLVLQLDPADKNSYIGSGTTVKNLSGNGNNGTLVGGVTFDVNNKGSFKFNGTDGLISIDPSSFISNAEGTIELWFNWDITSSNTVAQLCSFYKNTSNAFGISCGNTTSTWDNESIRIQYELNDIHIYNYAIRNGHNFYKDGLWHHVVFTVGYGGNNLYVDGENLNNQVNQWIQSTEALSSIKWLNELVPTNLWVGRGNSFFSDTKIGIFKVYDRALTKDEILQNYNVTKGRYGLS